MEAVLCVLAEERTEMIWMKEPGQTGLLLAEGTVPSGALSANVRRC